MQSGRRVGVPGALAAAVFLVSCDGCGSAAAAPVSAQADGAAQGEFTLPQRRREHPTKLVKAVHRTDPIPTPPEGVLEIVRYPAPLGMNAAYITPAKGADHKRPGMVWVGGGFNWGIDDSAWKAAPRDNDQSARAFREAGIVLMLPALRGASWNPGQFEGFFGEVDDVLAAADFLSKRPDVDPHRIYLGGHSTGATLALLTAESSSRFREVFAFGPVANVLRYGQQWGPFDMSDKFEVGLRSPLVFISEIVTPTIIMEGLDQGNAGSIETMRGKLGQAPVELVFAHGADHFSLLGPASEVVAKKIVGDTGAAPSISVTAAELEKAVHP